MNQLRQMAEDGPPTFAAGGADGAPYEIRATPVTADGTDAVPDVMGSDTPAATPSATVFAAWSNVMADVQWIGKGDQRADSGGRYSFRGVERVLNAVGPVLRKHGVMVLPVGIDAEYEAITTKGGAVMNYCRATVSYRIYGPAGDAIPADAVVIGEAFDTGDKSSTKAQSVALRTFYINALAIPTNEPERDPEHGPQYEREAPRPPSPVEYRDEILNPRTGKTRMLQIRRELTVRGGHGAAMVPDERDTGEVTLIELCERVGRERFAPGGGS